MCRGVGFREKRFPQGSHSSVRETDSETQAEASPAHPEPWSLDRGRTFKKQLAQRLATVVAVLRAEAAS